MPTGSRPQPLRKWAGPRLGAGSGRTQNRKNPTGWGAAQFLPSSRFPPAIWSMICLMADRSAHGLRILLKLKPQTKTKASSQPKALPSLNSCRMRRLSSSRHQPPSETPFLAKHLFFFFRDFTPQNAIKTAAGIDGLVAKMRSLVESSHFKTNYHELKLKRSSVKSSLALR